MIIHSCVTQEDYDLADQIKASETIRKDKPSKDQINEIKKIIRDFTGCPLKKIQIPDFNNVQDLELWKKNEIHKALLLYY